MLRIVIPDWIRRLLAEEATPDQIERTIMMMFRSLPDENKERVAIRCIASCNGLDTRKALRCVK